MYWLTLSILLFRIGYGIMSFVLIFVTEGWMKVFFILNTIYHSLGMGMNYCELKKDEKRYGS
jgi:hypothetical protein